MNVVGALLVLISLGIYALMGYRNFRYVKKYATENYRICKYREAKREKREKDRKQEVDKQRYIAWRKKCNKKIVCYWSISTIYALFISFVVELNNKVISNIWITVIGCVGAFIIIVMIIEALNDLAQGYSYKYHKGVRVSNFLKKIQLYLIEHKHILVIMFSPVLSLVIVAIATGIIMMVFKIKIFVMLMFQIVSMLTLFPIKLAMDEFVENDFIKEIKPFDGITLEK